MFKTMSISYHYPPATIWRKIGLKSESGYHADQDKSMNRVHLVLSMTTIDVYLGILGLS
jgi:hypothetical protein